MDFQPSVRLEGEASRQLDLAVAVDLHALDLSKLPRSHAALRVGEGRRVEQVEGIPMQFERVPFGQVQVLLHAEVNPLVTGSEELVAAQSAEAGVHIAAACGRVYSWRIREDRVARGSRIEPISAAIAAAGLVVVNRADDVGPVPRIIFTRGEIDRCA